MTAVIGTSGWQYAHWRNRFYPKGVPQAAWLEFYAARFATVESNNAFYRLPEAKTFKAWAERTPDDFVMAVKASRYLTHIRRLKDPRQPVELFLDHAAHLGPKLGPVLLQLPPSLKIDVEALDEVLALFPRRVRVAVEFRHETWFVDEVRQLLEQRGAALCIADRRGAVTPTWRTADWGYVRFHEGRATPRPCYGETSLATWASFVHDTWEPREDVYVYFNNDPAGCAIRDAILFARALERLNEPVTRVPTLDEITVG